MLADFTPADMQQAPSSEALMQVIDKIDQGQMGKVYFAARDRNTKEWTMKRELLSPRYTTSINDAPQREGVTLDA